MRLPGAFVTRFMEEWKFAGDTMLQDRYRGASLGEQHQRVERFLEAMKYELAEVLVPSVIPNTTLSAPATQPSQNFYNDSNNSLDKL